MLTDRQLLIEEPAFWGSGSRSTESAESGNLLKLVYMVGAITLWGWDNFGEVKYIPIPAWKGQEKKRHTFTRLSMDYHLPVESHMTDHEVDAIGIVETANRRNLCRV